MRGMRGGWGRGGRMGADGDLNNEGERINEK